MAICNGKTGIWAWVEYGNDGDIKVMMVNENIDYLVKECSRASYGFVIFWPNFVMLKEAVDTWLGLNQDSTDNPATVEEWDKLRRLIRADLNRQQLNIHLIDQERLVGRLAGTVLYDFLEKTRSSPGSRVPFVPKKSGGHCNLENSVIHYYSMGRPHGHPICDGGDGDEWVTYDHTATGRICPQCQRMLGRKIF